MALRFLLLSSNKLAAACRVRELQQIQQQQTLFLKYVLTADDVIPLLDPCVRVCVCVCQDGLSPRSALWDLCYAGAPPLQPRCYDPAERGALLCSNICCNAVTMKVLLMPTAACCYLCDTFKLWLQPSLTL